jgi:hypothetical protein
LCVGGKRGDGNGGQVVYRVLKWCRSIFVYHVGISSKGLTSDNSAKEGPQNPNLQIFQPCQRFAVSGKVGGKIMHLWLP